MTKEQFEKEAKEKFEQYKLKDEDYVEYDGEKVLMFNCEYYAEDEYFRFYFNGYLAGAEPREKRIEELEAQIEEMKSVGRTSYIKGIRTMANALKNYDRTDGAWTDYFEHTVDKVLKNLLEEIKEK